MIKILVVDDEKNILKSLKRLFIETKYEVYTADNGIEALSILETEEIALIISDMRMPQMDGYQLLSKVKELYPNIFRLILSGYADEALVFKSMKENIGKLYMYKPWNNEELIDTIDNIFETVGVLNDATLVELINNAGELPTIRESYNKIFRLMHENASMKEISEEIERDPIITSKVIRIVNSAYYGVKTGSLQQATSYLGLNCIDDLLRSTSVMEMMERDSSLTFYAEHFWKHAYMTNQIVGLIYRKILKKELPVNASTAGLLHNIGIAFMLSNFGEEYLEIIKKSNFTTKELGELELNKFGVNHGTVGGYLLRWWEFPYSIVECAIYHLEPWDKSIINKELVWAVNIAQNYASECVFEKEESSFILEGFDVLGTSYNQFMKIMEKIDF